MSDYDSPWKEALDIYFELFMAFFFPSAHREIDWSRGYEMLDKELQQIVREAELGRRAVDKLVKVWRINGQEEWILIHVEVQSQEEAEFPRRMYVYHYRLFDRYNRLVVSLAVLGDDQPNWRPDRFEYDLWGCKAGLQFPVVKLLDYTARTSELEASTNPFAVVVLAHLKTLETRQDEQKRQAWKIRLIKGLYDRGLSAKDVRQLFRFIDWLMDLPQALEDRFWQEIQQYEQEKRMPFIDIAERTALKKGKREGLLPGIELGLKLKFGSAGLLLLPEIRQVSDNEILEAVLQAIETAKTPDDLRPLWAK